MLKEWTGLGARQWISILLFFVILFFLLRWISE
jgi:hypothetical protein